MTNRLRIGFTLTAIIAALYSAAGLFDSLTHFGIGLAVAAAALIGHGCLDYCEARHDQRIADTRQRVWARRDHPGRL